MTFDEATDLFIADWKSYGRINSQNTEDAYRYALTVLSGEVKNRDPRTINRNDIKRALAHWPNPNTQAARRAAMGSFFKWTMQEGHRKDNPVDQTHPPKKKEATVYRLTLAEVHALIGACATQRERWVISLGIFAGVRNRELRGLGGRHFQREGAIWVSKDIGKGGRERWIPVIPDLAAVWTEIHASVPFGEWVLPSVYWKDPGVNTVVSTSGKQPLSSAGLRYIVADVAERAGIAGNVTPHTLRHAFGDHIARHAGMRNAQSMLGHKDIGTTQIYMDKPTLDELTEAVSQMSFGLPSAEPPVPPIEPIECSLISGIGESTRSKGFGRILVGLRADLAPVADALGGL